MSDVAADVHAPVLLVVAAQDDITPLDAQRKIHGVFPDATLAIIDGVGHLVHYEKPLEAAGFIRDFLNNR